MMRMGWESTIRLQVDRPSPGKRRVGLPMRGSWVCCRDRIGVRPETRHPKAIRLYDDVPQTSPEQDVLFGVTYEKLERYRED